MAKVMYDVKLKKVEYSQRQSEETDCFNADVYINGSKAFFVKNGGYGGPNEYHAYFDKFNSLLDYGNGEADSSYRLLDDAVEKQFCVFLFNKQYRNKAVYYSPKNKASYQIKGKQTLNLVKHVLANEDKDAVFYSTFTDDQKIKLIKEGGDWLSQEYPVPVPKKGKEVRPQAPSSIMA